MKIKFLASILLLHLSITTIFSQSNLSDTELESNAIKTFDEIVSKYKYDNYYSINNLMLKIGHEFLGKPYVGYTLEKNENEQLVVNLSEFDCTTFAENCLALARTLKNPVCTFDSFKKELTKIRYRNGELTDYTSRLHYFSDWIFDNEKKNIVRNISCEAGNVPFNNYVDYMSQHSESYKMLKNRLNFVNIISATEKEISARQSCYIPKGEIQKYESQIQDGDILGITTNIKGMDISHVVLAIFENEHLHILHASSKYMKVVVSTETLSQYLANRKDATGIIVARPL
jgi:hypothetical protein